MTRICLFFLFRDSCDPGGYVAGFVLMLMYDTGGRLLFGSPL